MLHSSEDPADLTPDQRRHEIAAILAKGVLRLHSMRSLGPESPAPGSPDDASDSAQNDLEVSATPRPHVTGI